MKLPPSYRYVESEPGPKMVVEALKLVGLKEDTTAGGSNPEILRWADVIGGVAGATAYDQWASRWYDDDSVPWCGLFMAYIATMANPDNRPERRPPPKYLSALEWKAFGTPVNIAMLGDVLIFQREGGGHVGMYVGEDTRNYFVMGGNQGDQVSVAPIAKARCVAIRRPNYLNQPQNVRRIQFTQLAGTGPVSTNEA